LKCKAKFKQKSSTADSQQQLEEKKCTFLKKRCYCVKLFVNANGLAAAGINCSSRPQKKLSNSL
jgi:hypothetical protein